MLFLFGQSNPSPSCSPRNIQKNIAALKGNCIWCPVFKPEKIERALLTVVIDGVSSKSSICLLPVLVVQFCMLCPPASWQGLEKCNLLCRNKTGAGVKSTRQELWCAGAVHSTLELAALTCVDGVWHKKIVSACATMHKSTLTQFICRGHAFCLMDNGSLYRIPG